MANELPKTIAERNEGLTEFWNKGYNFGLQTAIGQIRGEARWQAELKLRNRGMDSDAALQRLMVLVEILESFVKLEGDD